MVIDLRIDLFRMLTENSIIHLITPLTANGFRQRHIMTLLAVYDHKQMLSALLYNCIIIYRENAISNTHEPLTESILSLMV